MRRWLGSWGGIYALIFLLWVLANYPALFHSWWYRDDFVYGLLVEKTSLLNGLKEIHRSYRNDGRPLAILTEWPFGWNYYPHAGFNVAVHWAQGVGHCAVALLLASILSRYLFRWQAVVATAPFLLWCFNGEPVLYSSAYDYVLAAFFSILGLHFVLEGGRTGNNRSYGLGAILVACSLLTNQAPAPAGLIVWLATVAARLTGPEAAEVSKATLVREGAWLSISFFIGGLMTTGIAALSRAPRAEWPHDFLGKFDYWVGLNRTFFFWPKYYPLDLDFLLGCFLIIGVVVPGYLFLKAGRPGLLALIYALYLASLILPYLSNLVVAFSWMSFRSFYLAPLALTLVAVVLFRLAGGSIWSNGFISLLVMAICLNYLAIAQNNARDYVQTYIQEIGVIQNLEWVAKETHVDLVATIPDSSPANPFALHYPWLDGHECDFRNPASLGPAIRLLSPLRILAPTDDNLAWLREKTRDLPAATGVKIYPMPELHLIYLQVN
jgi:hypothetical protein